MSKGRFSPASILLQLEKMSPTARICRGSVSAVAAMSNASYSYQRPHYSSYFVAQPRYTMGYRYFSTERPKNVTESEAAKARLVKQDLLPPDLYSDEFKQQLNGVKVFYNTESYPRDKLDNDQAFSLKRALTKVMPIDVEASRSGELLSGKEWPGRDFFMSLKPGDSQGLAPEERVVARGKLIASAATIYGFGGYPHTNPYCKLASPQEAFVFTMAGMQFEAPQLDYKDYIIDAYTNPRRHAEIATQLQAKNLGYHLSYKTLKAGMFMYIQRDPITGKFSTSFSAKNALILNWDAYYHGLVKDFILLFASAEKMVDPHKPIYFKMPMIGMGYFSNINGEYSIKNYLYGTYFRALRSVLEKGSFPKLKYIEIPVFDEDLASYLDVLDCRKDSEINGVKLLFRNDADVLGFTGKEVHRYNLCILNPGDSNSYPGNEFGSSKYLPGSVESEIGNHTNIRYVQNYLLNPVLCQPRNWVGVSIRDHRYAYEEEVAPVSAETKTLASSSLPLKKRG